MRKCVFPMLACCLFLSGCSGLKDIQNLTYIVTIGMDYDKEKKEYIVYLQSLDFSNVAKLEGGKPPEPPPNYIASASGETLNLAVSKLYKKSKPPLYFGHVSTLVLSKRIVTDHFKEVMKEIGRNRSLRHTLKVMTTEESIEDVFNLNALFHYPPVYFKAGENELYQDEIKPMMLMNFLRSYFEPMGVAKLPLVKIDSNSWKAKKGYPIIYFDGLVIFQHQKFMDSIPFHDAVALNWLLEKRVSLHRKVMKEEELVAAVKLATPKMKVKYEKGTTSPKFSIEISANGELLEKIKDIPLKELERLIEEDLKQNIIAIFNNGVEHKSDVLNIGNKWFKQHPEYYQKLKNSKSFYLEKESLKSLKVKVSIFHFNSYKYEE